MLIMKSVKWEITERIEMQNLEKVKTLGEKEISKYLRILEADTINQTEMK